MGPALLFAPADRPERFAKAAERSDGVILDLEDAVAPAAKKAARDAIQGAGLDPARTIIRVNAADTEWFSADVAAVQKAGYSTVMLPKATCPADLAALEGLAVIVQCETAAGILAAERLAAHPSVVALMWGAEDLYASLGGTSSRRPDGTYRAIAQHARSIVALAAAAHGKAAIDAVYININDLAGLVEETDDAVASGFAAKACIHPDQTWLVSRVFRPEQDQVERAQALLAAAKEAGSGVFAYEGRMIDEPLLRHARSILARAGR